MCSVAEIRTAWNRKKKFRSSLKVDYAHKSSEGSVQLQKQEKLTYNCFNFSCEQVGKSVIMKEPVVNGDVKNPTLPFNTQVQSCSQLTNRFRAEKATHGESDVLSNLLPHMSALE